MPFSCLPWSPPLVRLAITTVAVDFVVDVLLPSHRSVTQSPRNHQTSHIRLQASSRGMILQDLLLISPCKCFDVRNHVVDAYIIFVGRNWFTRIPKSLAVLSCLCEREVVGMRAISWETVKHVGSTYSFYRSKKCWFLIGKNPSKYNSLHFQLLIYFVIAIPPIFIQHLYVPIGIPKYLIGNLPYLQPNNLAYRLVP
jgi:hypothetical protein